MTEEEEREIALLENENAFYREDNGFLLPEELEQLINENEEEERARMEREAKGIYE